MPFPMPPWSFELREAPAARPGVDGRPPAGPLAPFLGPRYTLQDLLDAQQEDPEPPELLALVRAFPVAPLLGATLAINHEDQLAPALARLLAARLPAIAWSLPTHRNQELHKYLIVHRHIPAPPDETTGQPMALELFAEATQIDGVDRAAPAGQELYLDCLMDYRRHERTSDAPFVLQRALVLTITSATYANTLNPGVGIPFYL